MKFFISLSPALFLACATLFTPTMANADCSCDSGNGLVAPRDCGGSYSRAVQRMYEENGGDMISCCRPRHVQDFLINCFNRCGQPGRAVQNSKHVTGQACDTSSDSIGHRYGLAYIPHHGSNHWQDSGGGSSNGGGGRREEQEEDSQNVDENENEEDNEGEAEGDDEASLRQPERLVSNCRSNSKYIALAGRQLLKFDSSMAAARAELLRVETIDRRNFSASYSTSGFANRLGLSQYFLKTALAIGETARADLNRLLHSLIYPEHWDAPMSIRGEMKAFFDSHRCYSRVRDDLRAKLAKLEAGLSEARLSSARAERSLNEGF